MAVLYLLLGGPEPASRPTRRTEEEPTRDARYLIADAPAPRRRRRPTCWSRDGVDRGDRRRARRPTGAEVVDAAGLVALPGLVDLHTHLREPGREDAETVETGTRAAALGGFTAVHAMANTDPVADTAGVVEQVWRLGREAGSVDVQPGRRGHRRARAASGWPSSARWPTPPPGCGSSPTTATASPTRC